MADLQEYLEAAESEGVDEQVAQAYWDDQSTYWEQDGVEVDDVVSSLMDAFMGIFNSGADYAEEMYHAGGYNMGDLSEYIDWERVWYDMSCEGCWTEPVDGGQVAVFRPI